MQRALVADIGGTNSRFAEAHILGTDVRLVRREVFPTQNAPSFAVLLEQLRLRCQDWKLDDFAVAIFAVPGPIEAGIFCAPPSIEWTIHMDDLRQALKIPSLHLVNDFVAQAFCCVSPLAATAECIVPGQKQTASTVAVLGAGTGLGKAFLVWDGSRYVPGASEGGHAAFPVENERELAFLQFVAEKTGAPAPSGDDIVSGKGLSYVHEFLTGQRLEPEAVAAQFGDDSETLQWASRFFARVCRNFALETLALGGLFIAGGVATKNPILLRHGEFLLEFRKSRVHQRLLTQVPVFVYEHEDSGLWGAAYYAQSLLKRH